MTIGMYKFPIDGGRDWSRKAVEPLTRQPAHDARPERRWSLRRSPADLPGAYSALTDSTFVLHESDAVPSEAVLNCTKPVA
jgi:hypothetical protein